MIVAMVLGAGGLVLVAGCGGSGEGPGDTVTTPRAVTVSSGLSLEPAQPATRTRPPTPSSTVAIIERVLMHRP